MSFRHGKNTGVFLDSLNATPYFDSADISRTTGTAEVTTFGATDKAYIAGVMDSVLNASGFYDGALGQIDDKLFSLSAASLAYPATYCPDGGAIIGRQANLANVQQTTVDRGTAIGSAATIKYAAQVTGGNNWGKVLNDTAQISATVPGTSVDWGAAGASTAGGVMNIHVTLNSRSTTTAVKLQHSTDNSVWVDLAGAAQTVPAGVAVDGTHPFGIPTAYSLTVAGAVNRYLRAVITPVAGTGVITAVVAFARF